MGIVRVETTHVGEGCDAYTRAAVAGDKTRGLGWGTTLGAKKAWMVFALFGAQIGGIGAIIASARLRTELC